MESIAALIDGRVDIGARQDDTTRFELTIPTERMRPGLHRMFMRMTSTDEEVSTSQELTVSLAHKDGETDTPRQIFVAAAMKSASQFIVSVLKDYFDLQFLPGILNDGEALLTEEFMEPNRELSFIVHVHPLARGVTLNTLAHYGLRTLITWRNVGDMLLSLDDHIQSDAKSEVRLGPMPQLYLEDRLAYSRLPAERRYKFMAYNLLPWYLAFFLSWRTSGLGPTMPYQRLLDDPRGYFSYVIRRMDAVVDSERLERVLADRSKNKAGFNVGIAGRSKNQFSEEVQALIEDVIRTHPSDLRQLLYELPWYAEKYGAPGFVNVDGRAYLVAGDTVHFASQTWLESRGYDAGGFPAMSPSERSKLRDGAPLF